LKQQLNFHAHQQVSPLAIIKEEYHHKELHDKFEKEPKLDLSPFPLNNKDTSIKYQQMKTKEYLQLVGDTLPHYFARRLEIIRPKLSASPKFIFRYVRVMKTFEELVGNHLMENGYIQSADDFCEIAQMGGGIDRDKLKSIIQS
jgi:hypothetical protein